MTEIVTAVPILSVGEMRTLLDEVERIVDAAAKVNAGLVALDRDRGSLELYSKLLQSMSELSEASELFCRHHRERRAMAE